MTKHRPVYPLTEEEIIRVGHPQREAVRCARQPNAISVRPNTVYRDAVAWLRDFADQKNIERGRVMCGGYWFTPQQIEAVRERARERATRAAALRLGSSSK